ncbi:SENP8-like protein [Mya arenaria]|uniref:SENP8-like protein n=1 Tax=Mya arenaria TaxID=6604 RepID=A0ABY7FV43_MYAAR|nr:SENP8-like protein [Mya arenaria]
MAAEDKNPIVLNFNDSLLHKSDVDLLIDNDIGNFLAPLNLPSKQFVFLPVNDNQVVNQTGGNHWNKQEFRHYDSLEGRNQEIARTLAYKIQPYVQAPRGRMKVLEVESPRQTNGYDCGMFVIAVAEHLCKELCEGYTIPLNDLVNPESVSKKRSQVKELIYNVAEEFGT